MGNNDLQKRGSLLGHGLLSGGIHIGQNLATRRLMRQRLLHKQLASRLTTASTGKTTRYLPGDALVGTTTGLVPEVGILDKEITHIGKVLRKATPPQLAPKVTERVSRAPEAVGDLLQGKFTKLLNTNGLDAPHIRYLLQNPKSPVPTELRTALSSALQNPTTAAQAAKDLEYIWQKYDTTKHLLSGVGRQITKAPIAQGSQAVGARLQTGGTLAGTVATAAIDPLALGINQVKHVMSSDLTNKRARIFQPIRRLQAFANKKLVAQPVDRMFNKGLAGKPIHFRKVRRFIDTNVMNPLTADIKNLSYDMGRLAKKYNPAIQQLPTAKYLRKAE